MKIQIVDNNDNLIGLKERSEVNYTKDIYRVSALWLTNTKSQVLIAQRAATKNKDPSRWGPAVAGTIEEGETYDSNIYKEAEEEIGLSGVEFIKDKKLYLDHPRKHFEQWYRVVLDRDISSFRRQIEEVDDIAWIDIDQLKEELQITPEKYLPAMPWLLSNLEI